MIDFSKVKGLTIPEGVVRQITDASGMVLWSATIKFTMNGVTYEADRGMTWAEWFASDYNTTGETEGDIKDADGNAVSLDAVIVGGTAYDVGFGPNLEVPEGMYLTFSSANSFTIAVNNTTKNWDGALYYSTDAAEWSEWDGTTAIASAKDNGEQRLYMRGAGNSIFGATNYKTRWVVTGENVKCNGNIECLLDYETVTAGKHPTMASNCFRHLFYGCTALTTAPSLPATTLATYCYSNMFNGCTSLTTAPSLPATTLANYCYYQMFRSCSNIKLSSTQTGTYSIAYRIPYSGTGTTASNALTEMFIYTGGTFAGTPSINTTYYLDSSNTIV